MPKPVAFLCLLLAADFLSAQTLPEDVLSRKSIGSYRVGDWGKPEDPFRVVSILNEQECLVSQDGVVVLLRGFDTGRWADGSVVRIRPVKITGTFSYESVLGVKRTVLVLDRTEGAMIEEAAAKKAEAAAKKAAEELERERAANAPAEKKRQELEALKAKMREEEFEAARRRVQAEAAAKAAAPALKRQAELERLASVKLARAVQYRDKYAYPLAIKELRQLIGDKDYANTSAYPEAKQILAELEKAASSQK